MLSCLVGLPIELCGNGELTVPSKDLLKGHPNQNEIDSLVQPEVTKVLLQLNLFKATINSGDMEIDNDRWLLIAE